MTDTSSTTAPDKPRSALALAIWVLLLLLLTALLIGLGTWQVKRLHWKLDLIARVDARVHAPAVPAPGPAQWADVTAENSEYKHVQASGTLLKIGRAHV